MYSPAQESAALMRLVAPLRGQFAAQLFDQMKRTAHRQERRDSEGVTARDRA